MITCRELADLLFDFTSGRLPAEYRELVEQHLRLCSCCVAYLESYRLTIEMTRQLPRPPLPPHLAYQLRALVEEARKGRTAEGQEPTRQPEPGP
jgi:anti-sigma factor RsiW